MIKKIVKVSTLSSCLMVLCCFSTLLRAAEISPVKDGSWLDQNIWSGGQLPGENDDVVIPVGLSIILTGKIEVKSITINGILRAQNDASIDLISRNNSIAWYGNIFDGSFSVSVFQCDYQKFKPRDHSFDEFIMILEGTLTLTEDTGEIHEFKKGDTLVFPKEFKGTGENSDNYKELIIIESGAMNDIPSMQDHHE